MAGLFANKHHVLEPVWHVQLAMLVAIGLQLALPDRLTVGLGLILPLFELLLLGLLSFTTPRERIFKSLARTTNVVLLIVCVTVANAYSLIIVMSRLLDNQTEFSGHSLLISAINIYVTNIIIFGLLFYEMDGGGPGQRQKIQRHEQDFLFLQHRNDSYRHPEWRPLFIDYLYGAATNAMTFGPTDTLPLSRRAKLLMLSQSTISLVAIAIVASRAIGILQ